MDKRLPSSKVYIYRNPNEGKNQVNLIIAGQAFFFDAFEPVANDSDKPEAGKSYKSGIYVPKDAPQTSIATLLQAYRDACEIGKETKWKGVIPPDLNQPVHNGDKKFAKDPEKYKHYKGMLYLNAKRGEDRGRPVLLCGSGPVTTPGVIQSGDWCLFDINFYPYRNKSDGVGVYLNGVTLLMEGERFGGGPSAQEIEARSNKVYEQLMGVAIGSQGVGLGSMSDLMGGSEDLLSGFGSDDDLLSGLL